MTKRIAKSAARSKATTRNVNVHASSVMASASSAEIHGDRANCQGNAKANKDAVKRVRLMVTVPSEERTTEDADEVEEEEEEEEVNEEEDEEGEEVEDEEGEEEEGEDEEEVIKGRRSGEKQYSRTTIQHYEVMVEFLEVEKNFKILSGNAAVGKPKGGQKITKETAYADLAKCINEKVNEPNNHPLWDQKSASSRIRNYIKKFRDEYRASNSTGYGLEARHIKAGLTKIEERKNFECPFYDRMEVLFGSKHNVNPIVVREFGVASSAPAPSTSSSSLPFGAPATICLSRSASNESDLLEEVSGDDGITVEELDEMLGDEREDVEEEDEEDDEGDEEEEDDDDDEPPPRTRKRDFASTFNEVEDERVRIDKRRLKLQQRQHELEERKFNAQKEEQCFRANLDRDKLEQDSYLQRLSLKTKLVTDLLTAGLEEDKIRNVLNKYFKHDFP